VSTVELHHATVALELRARYGHQVAEQVLAGLEARYRLPVAFNAYRNLAERERYRVEHGTTEAWDRSVRSVGFEPCRYERRPQA
jgi:hypothetical protein